MGVFHPALLLLLLLPTSCPDKLHDPFETSRSTLNQDYVDMIRQLRGGVKVLTRKPRLEIKGPSYNEYHLSTEDIHDGQQQSRSEKELINDDGTIDDGFFYVRQHLEEIRTNALARSRPVEMAPSIMNLVPIFGDCSRRFRR